MLGKLFFIAKMDHNNNHINEKIDFAKSVLEHNLSLINLADAKAGILLGIMVWFWPYFLG
jgi:hypothetical protein